MEFSRRWNCLSAIWGGGFITLGPLNVHAPAVAPEPNVDERARQTEQQMTDEERFSLLISVMGTNTAVPVRDKRIPESVPMSAGYTPGVPRLGVPALLMSDASLGITNPGYRPGDTSTANQWRITEGVYRVVVGRSAGDPVLTAEARLDTRLFGK